MLLFLPRVFTPGPEANSDMTAVVVNPRERDLQMHLVPMDERELQLDLALPNGWVIRLPVREHTPDVSFLFERYAFSLCMRMCVCVCVCVCVRNKCMFVVLLTFFSPWNSVVLESILAGWWHQNHRT